ncbi:MAG: anthranilate phosphoribosyltransferase [Thermoleophilia bacterium]|nr:anthranilate phosphoribosyltransferase [Thermoleophilia bacterium]
MSEVRDTLQRLVRGEQLSRSDAHAVMCAVMAGDVDDASFGALFATLHARGETVEELAGLASAMREHVVVARAPIGSIDTCGTGGDGADTFNVSTCAALVASGAGAVVAKHGNRAVSSSCGSADVLEALGGRLDATPEDVDRTFATARFAFLFAPAFHPSMRHAAGPRRALGIRTAFNFLGPITNPAGVTRQVVGVSDAAMAARIADVLRELGSEHALVVHGADGLDELSIADSSVAYDVRPDGVTRFELDPESLGLVRAPIEAIRGGDAARNAEILRAVLAGARGPSRDVVVLNAAAAILVADLAGDLREAAALAEQALDDGAALDQLERWIAATAEVAA